MKHETHTVTCEFPLINRIDVVADCGEIIENADVQQVWDDMATGTKLTMPKSTILMCDKCWDGVFSYRDSTPRKVYAVTERRQTSSSGADPFGS